MPFRETIFEVGQPVHIISRAIEERKIFNNEIDCFRFVFQLYAANIGKPAYSLWRQDIVKAAQALLQGEELSSHFIIKEHQPLVSLLDFSLVVNHNHLYLVPNSENSVPVLMKKLNNAFAQYFNLKHRRKGALFEGPYRAVMIKTQLQSDAVSRYVSVMNPLDVFQPGWREDGLRNKEDAFKFLEDYQFSSFPDKIGKRKSKILAPPEVLEKYLSISPDKLNNYREFVEEFLKERSSGHEPIYLE